jgi:hypothetical protein
MTAQPVSATAIKPTGKARRVILVSFMMFAFFDWVDAS